MVGSHVVGGIEGMDRPPLRGQEIEALINRAITLGESGCVEEEIAIYDEVEASVGDTDDPRLRELAATAMLYKGVTLGGLDRSVEAIAFTMRS